MPSKRAPPSEGASHQNKKQKFTKTRSIVVQKPGGPSQPSKPNAPNELPNSIDVEAFAESRIFEIKAMQEAMNNESTAGSTHRAWQELPRHLRRRAASHNVRRVPLRLRPKSRAEMDSRRRKILGPSLPKLGKSRREYRSDTFKRRQKDKKWLETHLWHAKRMHMENMWGYRLAVRPTEKSFRPSHRASVHGAILHDASYHGLIELTGAQVVLSRTLEACCDPAGARAASKSWIVPFWIIGPVFVIWRAMRRHPVHLNTRILCLQSPNLRASGNLSKRRRMVRWINNSPAYCMLTETVAVHQPETPDDEIRTVWIRCHPTIFSSVHSTLKHAVSSTLNVLKKSPNHSQNSYAVEVIDLRDSINVFEITGPKSSQVICGALTPTTATTFWTSLSDLQSTGSIPSNMAIGFTVLDPRLSFPPKNARAHIATEDLPTICKPWECFPTASLAWSDIWDQNIRDTIETPRYTKKELDARREQSAIPGTSLKPTVSDNRVPVLLIQRSVKPASTSSNNPNLHGWTLVVPKGWGMPFLTSLIYTGTRVGGQREREHQADFPTCTAYEQFASARAIEDKERWRKKPPAKRVSWGKLSALSPWTSDWRVALGLDRAPSGETGADDGSDEDVVPTQRDDPAPTSDPASPSPAWLLHGSRARTIVDHVSRLLSPTSGLLCEVNALRRKCELPPLDASVDADALLQGALMHVRVLLCGRGALDDMAFIYALEDQEATREVPMDATEVSSGHCSRGNPTKIFFATYDSAVIGFVTSGNFSLSRGKGYAIGAISLAKFLEIREQAHRLRRENDWMVKVRNRDGTICRAARVDFLE
ncbi:ribonucleases P/MRP protein subunit POP1-domain-containing protein [Lactarius quietus]|nr:ribonucleases P/MRP protein subunit POP1-domain-containing protein [Lactarius quietus]